MSRLRDLFTVKRQVEEEPTSDNFQTQINAFWENLSSAGFSPRLAERIWVANRCTQMNAQSISTMPLRHYGPREPAWVSNPDPVWYPNGISDAVFAIVWSMYGWGDAFVYVTSRYSDGYPALWTVLDPERVTVEVSKGRRTYRSDKTPLKTEDVVQITRDPRGSLRGTSALRSYASHANALLAAADLGRVMMGTGTPMAVLKSQRKLTAEQAAQVQEQWVSATSARRGAPAVLPPELDFEQLAFSPKDLLLLDVQTFDSQVIASAYGVPSSMINMPIQGGLNYQTPILLLEQWWRTELRPSAKRISNALSANMLARGSYVEFDAREFLAPTFQDLVAAWVTLGEKGFVTADELRATILHMAPNDQLSELQTPPSAGASPVQQLPAGVTEIRPTQATQS